MRKKLIHVHDASRSVPVASGLIGANKLAENTKLEYAQLREAYLEKKTAKALPAFDEVQKNKLKLDWDKYVSTKPQLQGNKTYNDFPLDEIREYIDWSPFFKTWMLKGKYPKIMQDDVVGQEANKLFTDANIMLDEIIATKTLQAKAVVGIYPASAENENVKMTSWDSGDELTRFNFLRQQSSKADGKANLCLADYIAPQKFNKHDYLGLFTVTTGIGIEKLIEKYEQDHDDYKIIMVKALADRLAEAFAELMHEKVRKELWGFNSEALPNDELIRENYQGIRPAPGYPACPDHSEKRILFNLLEVEENIGVSLTESCAMYPAASVSGFYFAHPQAKYFSVGKLKQDQIQDYAKRKDMEVLVIERWLSPNLGYDPDKV